MPARACPPPSGMYRRRSRRAAAAADGVGRSRTAPGTIPPRMAADREPGNPWARSRRPGCSTSWSLALLAYVPFLLSSPGKLSSDTKQYLYLDPGRFLARVPWLWDPHVAAGTVPHQQIGYLFPMGPYFWLADPLGVPGLDRPAHSGSAPSPRRRPRCALAVPASWGSAAPARWSLRSSTSSRRTNWRSPHGSRCCCSPGPRCPGSSASRCGPPVGAAGATRPRSR